MPLHCVLLGTNTDVGKTHVVQLLCQGLRALQRKVWLYKPVACGNWQNGQAEDARTLAPLVGDGQDPQTLCQHQWPAAASPHLAAADVGDVLAIETLVDEARALQGAHDLIIEGAGGVLSPLCSDRSTIVPLVKALDLPCFIVTTPFLGTIHSTASTVLAAQHLGLNIRGLIRNDIRLVTDGNIATDTISEELAYATNRPVIAHIPYCAPGKPVDSKRLALTLARACLQAEDSIRAH